MFRRGESGGAVIGNRKEILVTYATPREEILAEQIVLPIMEQATPTFSYIVQESDLPTFSEKPYSLQYVAYPIASGKNTDVANARELKLRTRKNGVSAFSYTLTCVANQYWTVTISDMTFLANVQVGDVIDVYLWQTTPNALYLDYKAFAVAFKRLFLNPYKANDIIYNFTITTANPTTGFPRLSLGAPYVYGGDADYMLSGVDSIGVTATKTLVAASPNAIKGNFTIVWGDVNNPYGNIRCSATYHPYPINGQKVLKFEWYPTALGV